MPNFKQGDRVRHIDRNENGTVLWVHDGVVTVEFDNPTPRGSVSVGEFDEVWFKTHEGWLVPTDAPDPRS